MDKNAIHYLAEIDNLKGSLAAAERRLEQFAQDIAYKLGLPYEPPVEKGDCQYLKGIEDLKERAELAEVERDQLRAALEAVEKWMSSEAGPLYNAWENCDLGEYEYEDGGPLGWEDTLANIRNLAAPSDQLGCDHELPAVILYRQILAALSPDCQRQAALSKREEA